MRRGEGEAHPSVTGMVTAGPQRKSDTGLPAVRDPGALLGPELGSGEALPRGAGHRHPPAVWEAGA